MTRRSPLLSPSVWTTFHYASPTTTPAWPGIKTPSISLCYVSGPTRVLPGLRLCHLQLGNSKLELIGGGQPHPRSSVSTVEDHLKPAGVIHLCSTVTDLKATTATLRSKGVEPFAGPLYVDALDITLVVIKDNSGNVLEIAQSG